MNLAHRSRVSRKSAPRRFLGKRILVLGLLPLLLGLVGLCSASAQPQGPGKIKYFRDLLAERQRAGVNTTYAEQLDRQSREAAQSGNRAEAMRLLDQAIAALSSGSPAPGSVAPTPGEGFRPRDRGEVGQRPRPGRGVPPERPGRPDRAGPPDRQGPGGRTRDAAGSAQTGAGGGQPVFVLPFAHHYNGPGGYYAPASEIRALAEFFHSANLPGTLFFDGILVDRIKKEDPDVFALINKYNLALGYHGEETHGPYPVPSDLFAEVYPLREAQGYNGTWSLTTGKDWTSAVQAVIERYSHALPYRIDEKTRMLDRRQETPQHLPAMGGLKLVQETFGRDVSFMPSHGLESAPVGFAFRKMSRFGLDQPAVPTALHALRIFKVGQAADRIMAIAGENVSIFWYMGRLTSKGDDLGETSWTPKVLDEIKRVDRSEPRLLLMGFSKFQDGAARETVAGLNAFFSANPGSGWVDGQSIVARFEGEKEFAIGKDDVLRIAAALGQHAAGRLPDLVSLQGRTISLCDAFEILAQALSAWEKSKSLPDRVNIGPLYGPVLESDNPLLTAARAATVAEIAQGATHVLAQMGTGEDRFVPGRVGVGNIEINPAEFLLAMAAAVQAVSKDKDPVAAVTMVPTRAFPPYADLLQEIFKPKAVQPLCYTSGQLWTVKPARVRSHENASSPAKAPQAAPSPGDPVGTAGQREGGSAQGGASLIDPPATPSGVVRLAFAGNLDSTGGCYREDPSGADLYVADYDIDKRQAYNVKRVTQDAQAAEWFPSLSRDGRWLAYNRTETSGPRGRHRQQIRVIDLTTGIDTVVREDARFPCFTPDGRKLVYSQQQRGLSQICVADFALGSNGTPVLGASRTVADQRHGAERVEDPTVLADGKRIAFHRKEARGGAGGAVIGVDGSGFAELTPLTGAGHAAASPDGRTISFSVSRDGRLQAVQEQNGRWTPPVDLHVSNTSSDFASLDPRLAAAANVAHTYMEWVAPDLLVVSCQAADGQGKFTGSRLLLLQFTSFSAKPRIHDLSGAIERATGKSGRDLCTASGFVLNPGR